MASAQRVVRERCLEIKVVREAGIEPARERLTAVRLTAWLLPNEFGGGWEIRTPDPLLAKQPLSR